MPICQPLTEPMSNELETLRAEHAAICASSLSLNMERGQPADDNFDLSTSMLSVLTESDYLTDSGVDVRNYPGGIAGIAEARALFAEQLGIEADQLIVGNNSSLELMSQVLSWALIKGVKGSERGWIHDSPRLIVTVPGYDRHFSLAETLGYELVTVPMLSTGPDIDAVASLAKADPRIKGMYFVPNYSNPTGDCLSDESAERLVRIAAAAPDFTVFADDAYAVHHLVEPEAPAPNLLKLAEEAGHPDRVILFGSTSKVTFASGGLAFTGMNKGNLAHWAALFSQQSIGPNKVEQWRHVQFLRNYPDGLKGLMRDHARLLKPKFDCVTQLLEEELGNRDLARWSSPKGGYFINLDTTRPVATRVVELAKEAGVALTPSGATYPGGRDPNNTNIRLAPTRPSLADVAAAMKVVVCCVKLASAEHDSQSQASA